MSDPFCPRHGRASRPAETPGLRCDCPAVVAAAAGPLKRGKWASVVMGEVGDTVSEASIYAVQERINRAVDEALMAGYRLGLDGGAARDRVHTCIECGKPWLVPESLIESNGLCLSCAYQVRA